jgi:hypothetical protein
MDFKEFFEDLDEIINGGIFSNLGPENIGSFMVFLDEGHVGGKPFGVSDNNDSPNSSTYE